MKSEIALIIICITIIVIVLGPLYYILKIYRLRTCNPIQELSPLLTILQGFSLQLYVLLSLSVLIIDAYDNFKIVRRQMIMINYFRGLFILVTIFKSLRIALSFQLNPDSKSKWIKFVFSFLKYQYKQVISAVILTAIFWTGLFYFIQLILNDQFYNDYQDISDLIQYETISYFEATNNGVEAILCLLIIYQNEKINVPQFDAMKKYISQPLIIYVIWLYVNTFFNYLINNQQCLSFQIEQINNPIPISLLFIWISDILRCLIEFYLTIYKPIKNSTYIRLPLPPSDILKDFQLFMRIPVCSTVFYHYVQEDQKKLNKKSYEQIQRRINQNLEFDNNLKVLEAWMITQMKLENGQRDTSFVEFNNLEKQIQETLFQLNSQEQIQIRLEKHLTCLFLDYKHTKSYQTLLKLFKCLDNATRNFYELNIIENFLN